MIWPAMLVPCARSTWRLRSWLPRVTVGWIGGGLLAIGRLQAAAAAGDDAWHDEPGYRWRAVSTPVEGKVGFTAVPAAASGILFSNRLSAAQAAVNQNWLLGSGVAAGDFDGDGWCDLYFCAIAGTNVLYRNLGQWRFEAVPVAALGMPNAHSTGATFADVDGDGRLDLLVATLGSGVHCFLNEGNGRFRETTAEAGLSAETGSTSLALADVDGDGDLDLYVANYGSQALLRSGGRADMRRVGDRWVISGPQGKRLRLVDGRLEELGEPDVLYLNDGQGRFRAVPWGSEWFLDEEGRPQPEPWDFGLSVQMRDVNGDGSPDIYVCNDFQTPDRFWINDGRGHFRALPRLAMRKESFSAMGVDFADLDRDGFLDFMVTEMNGREHSRRMREVVGMQPALPLPGRYEYRPEVARNTLFRNRGDGTYAELACYAGVTSTDWTWQPVFLDVDLDGYEDLLIVNGTMYDVQDRDALDYVRSLGPQNPEATRTNLALYPHFLSPNLAFRNRRDLTFEETGTAWGFDSTAISQGLALADLDHDGDLDVIINCLNAPPLLLRNDTAAPRVAVRLAGRPPNSGGIGAMIRVAGGPGGTQMQEVLAGGRYLGGDEPLRVFAAGNSTNGLRLEVRWRGGRQSCCEGVLPNRLYEVREPEGPAPAARAVTNAPAVPWFRDVSAAVGHAHRETLYNDFARQPLLMKWLSQLGPGVAWLDLDGDGREELIVGAGKGGTPSAFRWRPTGEWTQIGNTHAGLAPDDLTGMAAWVGPDRRPRILMGLANYESGATNGPAVVAGEVSSAGGDWRIISLAGCEAGGSSPGPLAVADMDADGLLELFVGGRVIPGAYPQGAASRLYRWQNGRWTPDAINQVVLAGAGMVSGAVWSDLNLDGLPELVLACEWGPVRVFANERGRLREATSDLGLGRYLGWWNGVTTGDFDEDGRLDIVASNWGLNSGYEATPEHPLRLAYGNLTGSGVVDLIETYYAPELGAEVPRRSLNALAQAIPQLLDRFSSHRAFGLATAQEVFGCLSVQPQVVSATTLTTMVFLNRGTNFLAVPLPAEAQFAPAIGVNVADIDGDGHEDLFLSQNFFTMRVEWPRCDAGRGLWLRGDGHGGFTPMSGPSTGVMVYGEQRGAAVGDFNADGRVDLAVTQNGAETKVYENVGAKPGLRVRLQGPPGNPLGIGVILRLQFGPRLGPARELHGGSGYWSQDGLVPVLATPEAPTQLQALWPGGKRAVVDIPPGSRELTVGLEEIAPSPERSDSPKPPVPSSGHPQTQ